jgi:hypothetical protein
MRHFVGSPPRCIGTADFNRSMRFGSRRSHGYPYGWAGRDGVHADALGRDFLRRPSVNVSIAPFDAA